MCNLPGAPSPCATKSWNLDEPWSAWLKRTKLRKENLGAMDHQQMNEYDLDEPLAADPLLRQLREQRYGLAQKARSLGSKYVISIFLVVLLVLPLIVNFGLPWNYSSELEPKAFNAMAKKQEDTKASKLGVLGDWSCILKWLPLLQWSPPHDCWM